HDKPADDGRIDYDVEIDILAAGHRFERAFERIHILVAELLGDSDLCGYLTFVPRHKRAVATDHIVHREQAAVGGDHAQEVCRQTGNAGLGENRRQSLELLIGAENGTAHKAVKVRAVRDERVEPIEILLDGIHGLVVEGELEQGVGITAGHAGDDRIFACHGNARCLYFIHRPDAVAEGRRKPLESKREFRSLETSRMPAETPRNRGLANTAGMTVQQGGPWYRRRGQAIYAMRCRQYCNVRIASPGKEARYSLRLAALPPAPVPRNNV